MLIKSPQTHFKFNGPVAVVSVTVIQARISRLTQKVLVARLMSQSVALEPIQALRSVFRRSSCFPWRSLDSDYTEGGWMILGRRTPLLFTVAIRALAVITLCFYVCNICSSGDKECNLLLNRTTYNMFRHGQLEINSILRIRRERIISNNAAWSSFRDLHEACNIKCKIWKRR